MTKGKKTCKILKEIRRLEQQLYQRQLFGKAVIVTGIFAALLFLASCGNEMYDQINTLEIALAENIPIEESRYFIEVEQMPSYPGGFAAMMKFLKDSINYPDQAYNDSIQGRVVCTFYIDKDDGSVSDIKVVKSVHPLLDAEAVRVISLMPNWIPGKLNGEPLNVKYTIPVIFRLEAYLDSTKVNKQ